MEGLEKDTSCLRLLIFAGRSRELQGGGVAVESSRWVKEVRKSGSGAVKVRELSTTGDR